MAIWQSAKGRKLKPWINWTQFCSTVTKVKLLSSSQWVINFALSTAPWRFSKKALALSNLLHHDRDVLIGTGCSASKKEEEIWPTLWSIATTNCVAANSRQMNPMQRGNKVSNLMPWPNVDSGIEIDFLSARAQKQQIETYLPKLPDLASDSVTESKNGMNWSKARLECRAQRWNQECLPGR